jgi:hypothetical protein
MIDRNPLYIRNILKTPPTSNQPCYQLDISKAVFHQAVTSAKPSPVVDEVRYSLNSLFEYKNSRGISIAMSADGGLGDTCPPSSKGGKAHCIHQTESGFGQQLWVVG